MAYSSTSIHGEPMVLGKSTEAQTYALLALAMALTVFGVLLGVRFAATFLGGGVQIVFLILELALIFTSRLWVDRQPLNYILFAVFPTLSGLTVTPYLMLVLAGYANGAAILLNALSATVFMTAAAAFAARVLPWDLRVFGRTLLFALLGLVVLALLQMFVPALRSTTAELFISGAGILVFSGFIAYDIQRVAMLGKTGANPFLLALSIYLDIFNLFLSILRFMIAMSGNRR